MEHFGGQARAPDIPNILQDLCRACKTCLAREVCPPKAIIRVGADEPPWVDGSRCRACWLCVEACPFEAVVRGAGAS